MRLLVSSRTFWTAASAVRPLRTASAMRPQPTAIAGEHAIGFDDVAVLARPEAAAGIDQLVDRLLHRRYGVMQPPLLGIDVLGDNLADHHAGLVQYRRPERQAPG